MSLGMFGVSSADEAHILMELIFSGGVSYTYTLTDKRKSGNINAKRKIKERNVLDYCISDCNVQS